jgi:hypothetical protein
VEEESVESGEKEKIRTDNKIIQFPGGVVQRTYYEIKRSFKTADDFQRVVFVCKALSTDRHDVRHFKFVVKVEKILDINKNEVSRLIATDGSRMHIAEIDWSIPPGLYYVNVKKDVITFQEQYPSEDDFYPNWQRLLGEFSKDTKEICSVDLANTSLTKHIVKNGELSRQFATIIRQAGNVINIRYLDDLAKISWKLYRNANDKKFIFKLNSDKELIALIMPFSDD